MARLLAQEMSKGLGQSVVIENRPGAAGTIGATAAARSEPDGYTLVMFPGGHPLYGATHKSLPFDTVTGFEWISTVVTLQFIALTRPEAKYRSMADLIAAAKAARLGHLSERRVGSTPISPSMISPAARAPSSCTFPIRATPRRWAPCSPTRCNSRWPPRRRPSATSRAAR